MVHSRKLKVIFTALLASSSMISIALAVTYPSYNTETDCRSCHGITADRHHQLVVNGTFQCTDCHPMIFNNQTQTYYPQLIRNCLICHPGKNHTQVHHQLAQQGLFVCSDCHPVEYDNMSGTYYIVVTWDCTVCHSTVKSIQNVTPTPTPTPSPAPQLSDPMITNFSPTSPVNNRVGDSIEFEITIDQIVNVTWLINGSKVQFNESTMEANYTNTSTSHGLWIIAALASNANGTVMYNWSWNVFSNITVTPIITSFAPIPPVNDSAGNSRKFGITTDQITNITWYINGSKVQFNGSVIEASYTNTSAAAGLWNVAAIATNGNGTASLGWLWNVSAMSPPRFSISGYMINDTNGNGVMDAGEKEIPGWNVTLLDSTDAQITSTTTDVKGFYQFTNLLPVSYIVAEETKKGWKNTSAAIKSITLSNQKVVNQNFTNIRLSIFGMVFNDSNGNKVKDPNESGLPGWTIRLFRVAGGKVVSQTAITDAGGNYGFTGLSPGDYCLSEGFMPGWKATTQSFDSIKLAPDDSVEHNFGYRRI